MKALSMLLVTAMAAPVGLQVIATHLYGCKDDPTRQAIVCKKLVEEKVVYLACPYDEHKACYEVKNGR